MRTDRVPNRKTIMGVLAAGLLAATALTASVVISPPADVNAAAQAAIDPSLGFADLVDRVMPAVVSVEVEFANVANRGGDGNADGEGSIPPFFRNLPPDSPFRDFFRQFPEGQPQPGPRDGRAQGSGFIISADGYVVTNNHVVQDADQVKVTLRDGKEYTADVIGTDPKTDLALIKIKDAGSLQYVQFSKEEPRVGDWVVAVGNPFGLGGTVTTGIISARGRDIGSGPYDDFLQIDAAINRGNSGGPAFNLAGDVVGINTAIFSPSGGSVGIGFAIPASTAESIVESLRSSGAVTRGWLGVQIQPVTDDIAESLGLAEAKGAIVADVTDGSPAAQAGFRTGDTVLKVDGQDVMDSRDLARKVAAIVPGKTVGVAIVRDGKPATLEVKIGVMPGDDRMASAAGGTPEPSSLAALGLTLAPAPDGGGVRITEVAPDSAAAERGLRPGDVILEVAGREVHGPAEVREALDAENRERVLMLVKSGDQQRFIALPVEPKKG